MEAQFKTTLSSNYNLQAGEVSAKSPSNIALVKYWGKKKIKSLQIHQSVIH